jgi:alkylation response protein AidB-like acyl-CoA dehydrogenase
MMLEFTVEEDAFRSAVRELCASEAIELDYPGQSRGLKGGYSSKFYRTLGERGLLGLQFPERYGGRGWSPVFETILAEELGYAAAPSGNYAGTVLEFGMLILRHGSEEQRQAYLPRIARGEIRAGHAYTEPDAGSDLAAVRTTAVRDGDSYVVNGHKLFASEVHRTDYSLLLARTAASGPPEVRLSLFVLDNAAPGLTVRKMATMGGKGTNDLFLDDVRVPAANLIGEENRGWEYFREIEVEYWAKNQGYYCGKLRRLVEMLVEHARTTAGGGRQLADIPSVRVRLARMATDVHALRLLSYRLARLLAAGAEVRGLTAVLKVYTDETILRLGDEALAIAGPQGIVAAGDTHAPLGGLLENTYRENALKHFSSLGHNYARNAVAAHRLGLPDLRERRTP